MHIKNHALNILSLVFILILFIGLSGCFRTNSISSQDTNIDRVFEIGAVDDLYQFLTYDEKSYPLVSAHRGGPDIGFPENSIETFAHVATHFPAIIECDVRITEDSILVLMHDETVNRTSTGKGKVSNLTLKEIKDLYLIDNEGNETDFRIPTLEEALLWGTGRVIYTLDVKRDVPYELVIDAIRKTKSESISIIITYSANQAGVVHRLAPDLMISATIKNIEDLIRINDIGIPDNRIVAFVGTSEPDANLYIHLHQHGIKTILGTIGNLDKRASSAGYQIYAELVERGADILSTDRPFEAYKALDFYIKKHQIKSPYIR